MSITISPNTPQEAAVTVPICFEGSAIVSIPQTDQSAVALAPSGTNWTYNSSTFKFTKTGGANGSYASSEVFTDDIVYGRQPFFIKAGNSTWANPGTPNNNSSWYIDAITDNGDIYQIEVFKYCNSNPCGSSSSSGSPWNWYVRKVVGGVTTVLFNHTVSFNELFYIKSDGINLLFVHIIGGYPPEIVTIPLPQTTTWRFKVGAAYVNNQITGLQLFKGSYQGSIPITWSAEPSGDIEVTGNTACFTSNFVGDYQICADSQFDEPVCVDIHVSPLNLYPIGLQCGNCVFLGDIVEFGSNGGQLGTLTVVEYGTATPVGTIIGALAWQAPNVPVIVELTYTIEEASVTCIIQAIEKPRVLNVVGDTISGLVPGDTFQLKTNYPYPSIIWSNVDCPNIVSENGIIHIPKRLNDSCFGRVDCYIRGSLSDVPDFSCDNLTGNEEGFGQFHILLRVQVDPIYPTPDFGGPLPLKWKPETPDYKVIVNTFEGGCSETYLRNQIAIHKWSARYDGLAYCDTNPCDVPCCDEEVGFINGFDQSFQIAKRLDDFWNLVSGTSGFFTMVDYRTGQVWKKCRFSESMARDHNNWYRTQSREVNIVWAPCCNNLADDVCLHNSCLSTIPLDPHHQYTQVADVIDITDDVSTVSEVAFDGFGARQWLRPEERMEDYAENDAVVVWRDHSDFEVDADGLYVAHASITTPPTESSDNFLNGFRPTKHIEATGGASDFYGQFFDLNVGNIGSVAIEAIIVLKSTVVAGNIGIGAWTFKSAGAGQSSHYNLGSTIYETFGNLSDQYSVIPPFALSKWNVYQVYAAANDFKMFLNGVEIFSTNIHTVDAQAWFLGKSQDGGIIPTFFRGYIMEYILWDKKLTSEQRSLALDYVNEKYSLNGVAEYIPLGGLIDEFNGVALDTGVWVETGTDVATVTGGTLNVAMSSGKLIGTINPYNFTDKTIRVKIGDGNSGAVRSQQLWASPDNTFANGYGIYELNNQIFAFKAGIGNLGTPLPYYPLSYQYWQLRFDSGMVYFEVSADSILWDELHSEAVSGVTLTALKAYLRMTSGGATPTYKYDMFDSDLV